MEKILFIAEKPDVGKELAKYFGTNTKMRNGYIESDNYIFTWGFGHILELVMPEEYNKKYKKWIVEDLPIIPNKYKHKVSSGKKEQFNILKSLIHRNDVSEIVNACDADREGELIFRLIYYYSLPPKEKKVTRMWFDTKEKSELIKSFENRMSLNSYNQIYEEAITRSIIDWSMGINFSRLYSVLYPDVYSVGRVQTPTLKLIVDREMEIKNFIPKDYYVIEGFFENQKTEMYFDNKVSNTAIYDLEKGKNIYEDLNKSVEKGIIDKIDKKRETKIAPKLYDLSALQQDANKKFGYSPKETLNIAQELYEKKKLLSYPRSDSRYLKNAMKSEIISIFNGIAKTIPNEIINEIKENNLEFNNRNFNDKKVDGHRAITPTASSRNIRTLSIKEKNIYTLVANRFLEQYLGDYIYNLTKVYIKFEGYDFYTKASQNVNLGWKKVSSKTNENYLPTDWLENKEVEKTDIILQSKKTKPKARYTGQSILKTMKKYNLGTPATQADIIEKLKQKKYIVNKKKEFVALEKGIILINDIVDEKIKSVELTKQMEGQLKLIRKGEFTRNEYIENVHEYVKEVINNTEVNNELKSILNKQVNTTYNNEVIGICPICGSEVVDIKSNYFCSNNECKFALWKNDIIFKKFKNTITLSRAKTILKNRKVKIKNVGVFNLIINDKDSKYLTSWKIDFENNNKKWDKLYLIFYYYFFNKILVSFFFEGIDPAKITFSSITRPGNAIIL